MEFRAGTLENLVLSHTFWQDRPTLVTGATGLQGGWLVPRLLAAGAELVCLVRDLPLQSRTGTALESPATWVTPDVL